MRSGSFRSVLSQLLLDNATLLPEAAAEGYALDRAGGAIIARLQAREDLRRRG